MKRVMIKALPVALLVCSLLLGLTACSRRNQAEQLAALDSALQSGVLTKDEYESKKAALLGPAATISVAPAVSPPTPSPTPVSVPTPNAPALSVNPAPSPAPTPPATPAPAPASAPSPPVPAPVVPARPLNRAPAAEAVDSDRPEPEPATAAGCEDAEYKSHENGPQSRFFPMPVAKVKQAALEALVTLDFTVHKNSREEIEASKKRHIGALVGAGGEREILRFAAAKQSGREGTRVTGETKKTFVGRVARKSWTAAVLAQTACNLR